MKKNILIITLAGVLLFTGCGEKEKENKKEVIKDQTVILEDQTIEDISFEAFNIVKDDDTNTSNIYFEIINNSGEDKYINNVNFTLYENGIEKVKLTRNLSNTIEVGGTAEIRVSVDVDLGKIDKVEYNLD